MASVEVTPVHAYIMDRAIGRMAGRKPERFRQERRKFSSRHLPGSHSELVVLDGAAALNRSDRDIIRWIGENHGCAVVATSQIGKVTMEFSLRRFVGRL